MTIDVIERAIESAKCRIYRVRANVGQSLAHQVKADNQTEIQQVTIEALEKQIPKKPIFEGGFIGVYKCPVCKTIIGSPVGKGVTYCPNCGNAIDWSEEE